MKILLNINQQKITALEYFRQLLPHFALIRNYLEVRLSYQKPVYDKAHNHLTESIEVLTDDELKEFDIIVFLREVRRGGSSKIDHIQRCHDLGLKVVFDIDDYWNLPEDHPMKFQYRKNLVNKYTPEWISSADLVTTTTPHFASTITAQAKPKWVEVLPNCVDAAEPQFRYTTNALTATKRTRFGWIGGVYHKPDLEMLKPAFAGLNKDRLLADQVQLCLGGYNSMTYEYRYIENLMTSNYSLLRPDNDYIDYLRQQTPMMDHISFHKAYRRLWSMDITQYASLYREIDVSLVPLRNTHFSKCKSELKIVEAGWFSRPVICSDITPYKEWIQDGVNGYLVGNNYQWLEKMRLMLDKSRREDMGRALNATIKEHFDINKWAAVRYQCYKKLLS